MRFAPTLDEFSAMRPLVDLVEESMAAARGQSLEQYRAEKAAAIAALQHPKKP